jgi:stearoyl-CoA desaturase (delta-9 desaturase)
MLLSPASNESPLVARRGRGYVLVAADGAGYRRLGALPFVLCHVLAFGALWTGVTRAAAVCFAVCYAVRILGVTLGYHRYFAHRSFRTSRAFQLFLAVLAETTGQKGVLWYASHHRYHHRHSDTPEDLHSPRQRGFLYAHVLWLFDRTDDTDLALVRDFARYPELRWIDRYWLLPPLAMACVAYLTAGPSGLFFGFFFNMAVTWHVTFMINSVAHRWGTRRFSTHDDSRNNFLLALLMLGEGWHNNHHHAMTCVRHGLRWWEIDVTYYVLKLLERLGVVWALREPREREVSS